MKANKDEDARATEGGTLRADGTRRKERKIRPGYTLPGCVEVYVPRHRRARGEDGSTGPRSLADLASRSKAVDKKDAGVDDGVCELEKEIGNLKLHNAQSDSKDGSEDEQPPGLTVTIEKEVKKT